MKTLNTGIPGVVIVEPDVHGDHRGFFMETWSQRKYYEMGLPEGFVQDNLSYSARGTLRGLHYQHPHSQGKLVSVVQGEVFDVAVDIRRGSPTFGKWEGALLSGDNHRQFYIPPGFAHGFCVVSSMAYFYYKCTDFYAPECEGGIQWNDPDIGIVWPVTDVLLSDKDARYTRLRDIPESQLPPWRERQ